MKASIINDIIKDFVANTKYVLEKMFDVIQCSETQIYKYTINFVTRVTLIMSSFLWSSVKLIKQTRSEWTPIYKKIQEDHT